uniref:Uncharacterized protein n=1 Tax=Clandestinovirus TaxID=2831644 RepID=A0A8F8PNJ2_9VIRU|nr:hypothetical protein KOM_12_609 [Clandestinovirus]
MELFNTRPLFAVTRAATRDRQAKSLKRKRSAKEKVEEERPLKKCKCSEMTPTVMAVYNFDKYEDPVTYYVPEDVFRSSKITRKLAQDCIRPDIDLEKGYDPDQDDDNNTVNRQVEEWSPYKVDCTSPPLATITAIHYLNYNDHHWTFTLSNDIDFTEDDDYEFFLEQLPSDLLFRKNKATRELFNLARKSLLKLKMYSDPSHITDSDMQDLINTLLRLTGRPMHNFNGEDQDEQSEDEDGDQNGQNEEDERHSLMKNRLINELFGPDASDDESSDEAKQLKSERDSIAEEMEANERAWQEELNKKMGFSRDTPVERTMAHLFGGDKDSDEESSAEDEEIMGTRSLIEMMEEDYGAKKLAKLAKKTH